MKILFVKLYCVVTTYVQNKCTKDCALQFCYRQQINLGLCDSFDALYLTNPSVGHAAALNLPCSIGNFKRRAFVPQMSNMAEIMAVLSNA